MRANLVVDGTNRDRHALALIVGVDAEAADAGDLVGEVGVAQFLERRPLPLSFIIVLGQLASSLPAVTIGKVAGRHDRVNAEQRRLPDDDVNVGRLGSTAVLRMSLRFVIR